MVESVVCLSSGFYCNKQTTRLKYLLEVSLSVPLLIT